MIPDRRGNNRIDSLRNIVRDPRHRDITLLDYAEIDERRFAGWRMGSIDLGKINRSSILRFSENSTLDPFSMTGRAALALLEELTATAIAIKTVVANLQRPRSMPHT